MFNRMAYPSSAEERYSLLEKQWDSLFEPACDFVTNAANLSALLYHALPDVNWVGFYRLQKDKLVLAPFQGLPACTVLPHGKGVCFAAVLANKPLRVDDVLAFPGHIACDSASRSEIVIPVYCAKQVYGVLDIDSPVVNRFTETDEQALQRMVCVLEHCLEGVGI